MVATHPRLHPTTPPRRSPRRSPGSLHELADGEATPLQEERPYWEEFFELLSIKDAHARAVCRHENGTKSWACSTCDCTARLERHLRSEGQSFRPPQREE